VFYRATNGFQAVFAAGLGIDEDHVLVEVAGVTPISVAVLSKKFLETKIVVEEEYANPPKADLERIDADNRAIGASYAKAAGAPQFRRAFKRPPGATTSTFGEWRTFNDGHRAQHLGLDVTAREGAKVAAINDGTVAYAGETFLAGNVVVIAHGAGISSLYFHLSKITVAEGDLVKQGDEIGRAGHTGRTTGPHLHLGIHVANGLVDPVAFLKLRLSPAPSPAGV
jgi:murein DD-endopeptidase MepM/ murein hydrolase activator NlpD